jgi:hypothetical protein
MAQIRTELRQTERRVTASLEETQRTAARGLERLRKMLRSDQVLFQETTMRFRRGCAVL